MVNFPGSLDSLSNPGATTKRNDPGFELHTVISTLNDIAELLEAKLGIGATTPDAAFKTLLATAAGTSAWGYRGMVPLAKVVVTGSPAATIDFTTINQNFCGLMIDGILANNTTTRNTLLRASSDGTTFDTGSNYDWQTDSGAAAAATAGESLGGTSIFIGQNTAATSVGVPLRIIIPNYASTTFHKAILFSSGTKTGTSSGNLGKYDGIGFWRNTAALAGVRLLPSGDSFAVGSKLTMYGLPEAA